MKPKLESQPEPGHVRPAIVGRRHELSLLESLLDDPAMICSVFIEGEAGIGKTRLVDEFLDRAQKAGTYVLRGHCYHLPEAGAHLPFLQILRQLSIGDATSHDELQALLAEAKGKNRSVGLSEDVRGQRARFLQVLSEVILQAASTTRTVLCVEDIQWADPGSLLVLNNLLDAGGGRLPMVCTVRSDEATKPDAQQLISRIEQKSHRIALRGLSDVETGVLASQVMDPGRLTWAEVRALQAITKGNPLFVRELVSDLQEKGLLDRYGLQEAAQRSQLPKRLSQMVERRLQALPSSAYAALLACSVVGGEFSSDLVARAVGQSQSAIEHDLNVSARKGLIESFGTVAESRYRFAHPLFESTLYDSLSPSERRRMHRRIAQAADTGDVSLPVGELARHYAYGFGVSGGRRAVDSCRAAAENAERLMAYEIAARYWELALRCTRARSHRVRADLYSRAGWAFWAAGNWTQAMESWERAILLFESVQDNTRAGELALGLGELHRFRQELTESEHWLNRALEFVPDATESRGRALALLGSIASVRDDTNQALDMLSEAERLLGEPDPAIAYWLSFGYLTGGAPSRAEAIAKKGLLESQRRGNSRMISLLAGSLVQQKLSQLQIDSALSYNRLVQQAVEPTDTATVTRSLVCSGWLAGYTAEWDQLVTSCEQWLADVRLAGPFHVATARVFWAEANLALGNVAVAESEIRRALPDLAEMRPLATLHLARILAISGKVQEAAALARQCAPLVLGNSRYAAARAVLGEVASYVEVPELWQRCYDSLLQEGRELVVVYSPISVRRVLGRLSGRLRKWSLAIGHFEDSVHQLEDGKARWELVNALLDHAETRRLRRRRGDSRRVGALELQAKAILEELGIERPRRPTRSRLAEDSNRFGLTGRELEVLALLAGGQRNQEIAASLTVTSGTVNRHVENIFAKMGVNNRTEAVVFGVREGLVRLGGDLE